MMWPLQLEWGTAVSKKPCKRWIAVCVDLLSHPVVGPRSGEPYSRMEAWVWLLANAAVDFRQFKHKGKVMLLERGQLLAARSYLAKTWCWSEKRVRTYLSELRADGSIEVGVQSKGRYANVISICNYDLYQHKPKSKGQKTGQVKGQTKRGFGPDSYKGITNTDRKPLLFPLPDKPERKPQPEMDGALSQDAAQAHVSVAWTSDGRLEVKNGFRAELLSKLGGDEIVLRDSLDDAAAWVGEGLHGLALQKAVRSQVAKQASFKRERKAKESAKGAPPATGHSEMAEKFRKSRELQEQINRSASWCVPTQPKTRNHV